jgi:carbamoyl-phosphate synthase large subunit
MPKIDVKSILVIGAGPIVIGQACEFDYSGTQACKVLKSEGYKVILINSNPATIMTDVMIADKTYIEPINKETVEKIIAKERPDTILPTVGGQTALNCALELWQGGVLNKYGVKMLGADPEAIEKAENRAKFNKAMAKIGLEVPKNAVVNSLAAAKEALKNIGLPAIIRPSFTLGGSGGGIANTDQEFERIVSHGLDMSPTNEVLIDESIIGWKEYEMEVIRDRNDNVIIVCSIENIDPMGVHTGDSVTVAPALTLSDKEYQKMRDASIAVLREIGVETGGSNVQFAVNPKNGRLIVIEMNPRVSRSSALASKATGFPIAKVAALLAIGYTLDEIPNDITKKTPASFEPTIDYVVTKMPRFTFEKFNDSSPVLSSAMRSVGEAMAIGRNFTESLQKVLCSMEIGLNGLNEPKIDEITKDSSLEQKQQIIKEKLSKLIPDRIILIAQALRYNICVSEICQISKYDKWFVNEIKKIIDAEREIKNNGLKAEKFELLKLKKLGFSDERLAEISSKTPNEIKQIRKDLNISPIFKKIDTCAAEFDSDTPYMYSCYEGDSINEPECEANVSDKKKIVILGGGPNRIGQGIEFDYACVHAAFCLSDAGFETIMINCNPETVSTDYDTSDRLYFEPMTSEHVIAVIEKEITRGELLGVVVQFGGQTALKLAKYLNEANIPILGTSYEKINLAEDRERFQKLLNDIDLKQPKNDICYNLSEIAPIVKKLSYPIIVRPSNVLGGRAMEIIYDDQHLEKYIKINHKFILDGPILIDKFLKNAIEIDVDCICDGDETYVAGIMEHIEEAGIHSGDSACSIPPYSISKENIRKIKEATIRLAKALEVVGSMNIQFAIKDDEIYVIEANPRASRTLPFVAKSTGVNVAKISSLVMAGQKLKDFNLEKVERIDKNYYSVKEVVFPFTRFDNADVLLGPEMKSTGEVMGIDKVFEKAFIKAQIATNFDIASKSNILISVKNQDKTQDLVNIAQNLEKNGYFIYATSGTYKFLIENDIKNIQKINREKEGGYHIINLIKDSKVDIIINTTSGAQSIKDSFNMRRQSIMSGIFYLTTIRSAICFAKAIDIIGKKRDLAVNCLQELVTKN